MCDQEKKLLVLDLDETLVHASENLYDKVPHDFFFGIYYVYKRPYVDTFLAFAFEYFRVAVWTSATSTYAEQIVLNLFPKDFPLEFVWSRERCVRKFNPETGEIDFIKDLKKVKQRGFSLESILVVDDSPEKLKRNYGNLLRVKPFEGDQDDRELVLLMKYLKKIKHTENFRSLEKRFWREQAS